MKSCGINITEQSNIFKYHLNNGNELARIENGNFTVSIPKGSIPNPENYISAVHLLNHSSSFIREGAGFIVVKGWLENGSFISLPPRKFVGLQSQMNSIISRYRASGNDWTILRDELNLGANTNLAFEEIYYIKINGNDNRFTFDMPDGNEGFPSLSGGAIVGEWVPGGYTKNGIAESVLVGSDKIIHNKNINQLLNYFPGQWEKIK